MTGEQGLQQVWVGGLTAMRVGFNLLHEYTCSLHFFFGSCFSQSIPFLLSCEALSGL